MKEFFFGGRHLNSLVSAVRGRSYRPFHGAGWLQRWFRFTVVVEIGHTSVGVFLVAYAIAESMDGDFLSAAMASAINTLLNLYPVMVQRYNRARLVRIFGVPRFLLDERASVSKTFSLGRWPECLRVRITTGCSGERQSAKAHTSMRRR
jgi:hypothetical protein